MDFCSAALFWLGVGSGFAAGVFGTVGAIILTAVWFFVRNLKREVANESL